MVNVLSPPPTPEAEVPNEVASTGHAHARNKGYLNLPGFGNINTKTPEPTLNSLQAVLIKFLIRSI